jgi:HAD superfamily hydrolase (TIGR01549 family)
MAVFMFDFDGTLADSLGAIVAITNRLAPEFGYAPIPLDQIDDLKHLPPRQLIWQSQISVLKIPALLRRVRRELRQQMTDIPLYPGLHSVLHQLRQHHTLCILTSNVPENVIPFLGVHGLQDCFGDITGGGTLFGKARMIRRGLAAQGWSAAEVIYVGDEVRDVEAAHAVGLRIAAVTWGFNSRERLASAGPDWLIDTPEVLLTLAAAPTPR